MSKFFKSFSKIGAKTQPFRFTFHLDKLLFSQRKQQKVQILIKSSEKTLRGAKVSSLASKSNSAKLNEIIELRENLLYKQGKYQKKIAKILLMGKSKRSQMVQMGFINIDLAEYVNRSANQIPKIRTFLLKYQGQ